MGCKCNECNNPFVLPVGPPGAQGQDGADGTAGAQGAQGNTGATGSIGATGASGSDGRGYDAESSTSLDTLDTSAITATGVITAEKAYTIGARVRFSDVANPSTNFFEGIVTYYDTVSGSMNVGSIDLKRGSGTISSWDVNLAGEYGLNTYDSGWNVIGNWDGTSGLPPYTAGAFPVSVRIVGRRVHLDGLMHLPLATSGAPTTLITDVTTYDQAVGSAEVQICTASGYGFAPNANGSITKNGRLLPVALDPTSTHIIDRNRIIQRPILSTGSVPKGLVLTGWITTLQVTTGGILIASTHKDIDDEAGATGTNSPLHLILSNVTAASAALDFTSWQSNSGAFPSAWPNTTYPATFDAHNPDHMGGFLLPINTSWVVSNSLTEQQLRDAFAAIP